MMRVEHEDTFRTIRSLLESMLSGFLDSITLTASNVLQWLGLDLVSKSEEEEFQEGEQYGTLASLACSA